MRGCILRRVQRAAAEHEFPPAPHAQVRCGATDDVKALAAQLEEVTDSLVIHSIGFTVTLYRDKDLPRPAITLSDDAMRRQAQRPAPPPSTREALASPSEQHYAPQRARYMAHA